MPGFWDGCFTGLSLLREPRLAAQRAQSPPSTPSVFSALLHLWFCCCLFVGTKPLLSWSLCSRVLPQTHRDLPPQHTPHFPLPFFWFLQTSISYLFFKKMFLSGGLTRKRSLSSSLMAWVWFQAPQSGRKELTPCMYVYAPTHTQANKYM